MIEDIDRESSWTYFDGVAQVEPRIHGESGLHFINGVCYVKFTVGLGPGTNNHAELIALES